MKRKSGLAQPLYIETDPRKMKAGAERLARAREKYERELQQKAEATNDNA